MKYKIPISILFISFWILPLLALYFTFSSYNMMALYGDQTSILYPSEFQNEEILNLRFWRDFHIMGFWASLILIPVNLILYIYLIRKRKNDITTKAKAH